MRPRGRHREERRPPRRPGRRRARAGRRAPGLRPHRRDHPREPAPRRGRRADDRRAGAAARARVAIRAGAAPARTTSTRSRPRPPTCPSREKIALLSARSTPTRARRDPRVAQVMASVVSPAARCVLVAASDGTLRERRAAPRARERAGDRRGRPRPARGRLPGRRRARRARASASIRRAGSPLVDEAVRLALLNLEALPCPAGTMDVVLGSGLVRRAAPRGDRPRPRGRLQPQGHLGLRRPHRRARRRARRHRGRRRHPARAAAAR